MNENSVPNRTVALIQQQAEVIRAQDKKIRRLQLWIVVLWWMTAGLLIGWCVLWGMRC